MLQILFQGINRFAADFKGFQKNLEASFPKAWSFLPPLPHMDAMAPFSMRTNLDQSDGSAQHGLMPLTVDECVL